MMATCCCPDPRPLRAYKTTWTRATWFLDRKRVTLSRGLCRMPRAGLDSTGPHSMAQPKICFRMSRTRFAPGGADRLQRSNDAGTANELIS